MKKNNTTKRKSGNARPSNVYIIVIKRKKLKKQKQYDWNHSWQ